MDSRCSAWPLDRIEAEDESSTCPKFLFSLNATLSRPLHGDDFVVDDVELPPEEVCTTVSHEVSLPFDVVMGEESCRFSAISNMLLDLQVVPVEPFMVHNILYCVGMMCANKRYAGRKVLRVEVQIEVSVEAEDGSDEEEEDMDDEEQSERRSKGASKESIEALRKVKVEEGSEEDRCSICCEDFLIGFEATLMPCSHRFHGDCINKWLVKSKFCPLCRFELIN